MYVAHSGKPDKEKESFLNYVALKVGCVPQDQMMVFAGDVNDHVGKQ